MQIESKTRSSIKNIKYSSFSFFINFILNFISRTIFIKVLGSSLLGVSAFFSNILGILSLSELGIGSVMSYMLYKPIKENDVSLIKTIMRVYAKMYRIIGIFIIMGGLLLTPFLSYLIKDLSINIHALYVYYIIYVINAGSSYFFAYKGALLISNQKEYILRCISVVFSFILFVLQIACLLLTRNYAIYLSVAFICTLSQNLYISYQSNKMYPYIKDKEVEPLTQKQKDEFKKSIVAMIRHKIGMTIKFYTDNLLIAKFIGLTIVGMYSNYVLLVSTIDTMIGTIFSPLSVSVGMLSLSDDKKHIEEVLYTMLFINFVLYFFCSIALFCLIQPFIILWIGEKYVLSMMTLFVLITNFYISGMRRSVLLFWESAGIFKYDKYKPIIESIINLIISLILVQYIGIAGVLLGTIISVIFVAFWWESYLLFKHLLQKGVKQYLLLQIKYLIITLFTGMITYYLCGILDASIPSFLIKMIICCIVPFVVIILLFGKTKEFISAVKIVLNR